MLLVITAVMSLIMGFMFGAAVGIVFAAKTLERKEDDWWE